MDTYFPRPGSAITSFVATDTYANIVANYSDAPDYTVAMATDVGEVQKIGTRWVPVNGETVISQMRGVPVFISGTLTSIGATGAIVFTSSLGQTFAKSYMYFGAGQLFTSSLAGFYYVEMSSDTNGIVYNNTYTVASGNHPLEPSSKTAFSGLSGGSLTGTTGTINLFQFTLPAGVLGSYGALMTWPAFWSFSSANNKTLEVVLGSTTVGQAVVTTSPGRFAFNTTRNAGSESAQISTYAINNGTNAVAPVTSAEDTSGALLVTIRGSHADAAEWLLLFGCAGHVKTVA